MSTTTVDLTVMTTIHDAFRRDLDELTRAAGMLGDTPAARERIHLGWHVFAAQLHHHHTVEDEQLWPLVRRSWIRSKDGSDVLTAMEQEHELVDPAIADVDAAVAGDRDPREPLHRLRSLLLDHLRHEEAEAMPLITAVVPPKEWDRFGSLQARSLGLRGAAEFFPWMLRGMDDIRTERVLGVLPPPLRWAYRRRWQPRWAERYAAGLVPGGALSST
jgi:hypothetical protein